MSNGLQDNIVFPNFGMGGDERSWFAVQTKPRYEKKVASGLEEKGVTVFLPLVRGLHQWSDRKRNVQLPLFTGYAFVRIGRERGARIPVLRTHGVVGLVGMGGRPIPIPDEQIQAVQTILKENVPFTLYPFLNVGRKIRLRGGCLDGIQGVILALNGDQSLIISVDGIQQSLAIRVAGYGVEAA